MTPEQLARLQIDALLVAAGWAVQDYGSYNPGAARGIALRQGVAQKYTDQVFFRAGRTV